MSYDDIPKTEIRALRRAARWKKKEILWRQLFLSTVATLIGVSVGDSLGRVLGLPNLVQCLIVGFVYSGLYMVFQEAAVEPLMRREVEKIKNEA